MVNELFLENNQRQLHYKESLQNVNKKTEITKMKKEKGEHNI